MTALTLVSLLTATPLVILVCFASVSAIATFRRGGQS